MKIVEYHQKYKNEVLSLLIFLQDFEKNIEPTYLESGEKIVNDLFANLIKDTEEKNGKIYLLLKNEMVVGFISGHIDNAPENIELIYKKYFYISNIAILPKYQGQGFGKQLINKIFEYIKQTGLNQVQINVLSKNKVAHEMYQKAGFRDYEIILTKKIK